MSVLGMERRRSSHGSLLPLDLWAYRELLRNLVVRDLKVKYARSTLGFVWTLLNPLAMILVLVGVFSHIVRIGIPDFWAFLISGYFVWRFVAQTLSSGGHLLAQHAALRRSVAFPQDILVLSTTATRFLEFFIEIVIVMVVLSIFHHHAVPLSFLLTPLLIAMQLLMVIGLVMPITALSAFYADVQHAVPPALLALFYISPVFYSAEMVPESIRPFYFLNPLAGLLTLYHEVLYDGVLPSLALLAGTAAAASVIFLFGYLVFNRYRPIFAEVV